ncbi:Cell division protein FtsK [Actinacidiphila cocklensis]|uniref:Cell division protein FtsK n=1 Tax=Actinacidiphila cocklensis TaxID=887465 RepID=A0A9W4DQW2_9ACTN|nr:Cell division protein FtsK [Actinacidiphila cocklensis]
MIGRRLDPADADRRTGPGAGLPALAGVAPRQPAPGARRAARPPALGAVRPLGGRDVDTGPGVVDAPRGPATVPSEYRQPEIRSQGRVGA